MIVCSVAYVAGVLTIVGSTASVLYMRQQLPAPEEIHIPLPTWHRLTESVFRTRFLPEIDQSHSEILQTKAYKMKHVNSTGSKVSRQHGERLEKSVNGKARVAEFRQKRQLSGTGFLTLVMLKDTVLQLVSGLYSKYSANGHSKDSSKLETDDLSELGHDLDPEADNVDSMDQNVDTSDVICSCGCCGQNSGYDKLCYNLTSPFANMNKQNKAHGHWNSNGPKLKLGYDQGRRNSQMENMNCFPDFACQCCCAVTPSQEWVRPSHDNSNLFKSTFPFHRIEEPFVGMTFGFGTSSSIAAAAG